MQERKQNMLKDPLLDENAPWKQRYRVPASFGQIAHLAPERGLVASDRSGVFQLYAWNVRTGELTQLTNRPEGVRRGTIAPDGAYIYYHHDRKGDEVGHIVRIPFAGGSEEDITPDLPLYENYGISFSSTGNRLAFTAVTEEGFEVYSIDIAEGGALGQRRWLYRSRELTGETSLSHNGEVIVIQTVQPGSLYHYLIAVAVESGQQMGQLWEASAGASVELEAFSPLPGDLRVLATSDLRGSRRPIIWNVRNGDRTELAMGELEGEV